MRNVWNYVWNRVWTYGCQTVKKCRWTTSRQLNRAYNVYFTFRFGFTYLKIFTFLIRFKTVTVTVISGKIIQMTFKMVIGNQWKWRVCCGRQDGNGNGNWMNVCPNFKTVTVTVIWGKEILKSNKTAGNTFDSNGRAFRGNLVLQRCQTNNSTKALVWTVCDKGPLPKAWFSAGTSTPKQLPLLQWRRISDFGH